MKKGLIISLGSFSHPSVCVQNIKIRKHKV